MTSLEEKLLWLGRVELAQDILGGLIAVRSAWMGDERENAVPDQAVLSRLRKEQILYSSLRRNAVFLSLEELDSLIEKASVQLKAEDDVRNAFKGTEASMSNDGKLSPELHQQIFKEDIEAPLLAATQPVKEGMPLTAIFLGGQPGSGKSGLKQRAEAELPSDHTIVINVDELRQSHPKYRTWQSHPATEKIASSLSHADASAWAKELFASVVENRRNIIFVGTLSNPSNLEKQFAMLKKAGYDIIVRALAVRQDVSHLRVLNRFEEGKQKGAAHWVPPEVEKAAYDGLPKTLEMAEQKQAEYGAHVQVFTS